MTSSPHGPYGLGYTRATVAGKKSGDNVRWGQSERAGLSSGGGLQIDSMKSETLVSADQQAAGNTCPGLVHTALHTTGVDWSRSG